MSVIDKNWYRVVIDNWAQITVILGLISFIISKFLDLKIRKKEIQFSKLQENKILEIKLFYKSYHSVLLGLKEYLYQTEYGEHNPEIIKNIKNEIRIRFIETR